MDVFILLLLGICLAEMKAVRPLTGINEEYSSLSSFSFLKGLFAVTVVFHHTAQVTSGGVLFPFFARIGTQAVAVFFFITGYGLMKKRMTDPGYLNGFVKKKVCSLAVPYLAITLIYLIAGRIMGETYSISGIVRSFLGGYPVIRSSWYIITVFLVYMVFYLAAEYLKKPGRIILALCGFCLVWTGFCMLLGFGSWWYSSLPAVIIGLLWAWKETGIRRVLKQNRVYLLTVCAQLLLLAVTAAGGRLGLRAAAFFCGIANPSVFALLVICLWMKVKPKEKGIMTFLGSISLEIYLMQELFLLKISCGSEILSALLGISCTVVSSFILHRVFRVLSGKLLSWHRRPEQAAGQPETDRKDRKQNEPRIK